jgi:cell filamentation protein, protein adenylyltransferase
MSYDAANDPYIDQQTGILSNVLGLQTKEALDNAEEQLVFVAITALTTADILVPHQCTLEQFLTIHKQLFKEIYSWAGTLRTVELGKGNTSFARVQSILRVA